MSSKYSALSSSFFGSSRPVEHQHVALVGTHEEHGRRGGVVRYGLCAVSYLGGVAVGGGTLLPAGTGGQHSGGQHSGG